MCSLSRSRTFDRTLTTTLQICMCDESGSFAILKDTFWNSPSLWIFCFRRRTANGWMDRYGFGCGADRREGWVSGRLCTLISVTYLPPYNPYLSWCSYSMNVATLASEEVATRAGLNLTEVEKRTWEALAASKGPISPSFVTCAPAWHARRYTPLFLVLFVNLSTCS